MPALRWLAQQDGAGLRTVICQPDKPAGRRQVLTPPPVKPVAEELGLRVRQPRTLRELTDCVLEEAPDLIVVMAYGRILPRAVLDAPRLGCLNLHASLLPRHRGASPVQAAILAGDAESGITLMHMAEGLDTGDIAWRAAVPLAGDETGGTLHHRLALLAPAVLQDAWPSIAAGTLPRIPQNDAEATHCGRLTRAEGVLAWSGSAESLGRRIRAFDPWPGTSTTLPGGDVLKIFPPVTVTAEGSGCAPPGTVLAAGPHELRVACGAGSIAIQSVQPAGRRRMTVREFLAGHRLEVGTVLGA